MKFLLWIVFIALGMLIMRYRYQIYHFTGEWGWATNFFGGNGTIVAISLMGFLFIVFGTAYPFGVFDNNLKSPLADTINSPFWR